MEPILRLINTFATPQFGHLPGDTLYKARLLIGLTFSLIATSFFMMAFFSFAPALSITARLVGIIPSILMGLCFAGVLWVLQHKGEFVRCAHAIIAVTFLSIAAGNYMTGGPVITPSGTMLFIPVFMAYCLLDIKDGFIWGSIILLFNLIGTLMYFNGYEFPTVIKPEMLDITRSFNWFAAFIILLSLLLLYVSINNHLKQERDIERDRYKHVAKVAAESTYINETTVALEKSGKDLFNASLQQKTAIEQLSTTAEQLGATAAQNRTLAASAMQSIQDTEKNLNISFADIMQMVATMDEVQKSSEEIKIINTVIDDIAYQTNMLSLNAMIEASRAGDGNGGFKVVAVEVKKLSERSAKAAENINKLLERNFHSVKKGSALSITMQKRFKEITENVKPVTHSIQNVSDASHEQHEAILQIMQGLLDIDRAIENNQALSKASSVMAEKLKKNSASMQDALATLQNS